MALTQTSRWCSSRSVARGSVPERVVGCTAALFRRRCPARVRLAALGFALLCTPLRGDRLSLPQLRLGGRLCLVPALFRSDGKQRSVPLAAAAAVVPEDGGRGRWVSQRSWSSGCPARPPLHPCALRVFEPPGAARPPCWLLYSQPSAHRSFAASLLWRRARVLARMDEGYCSGETAVTPITLRDWLRLRKPWTQSDRCGSMGRCEAVAVGMERGRARSRWRRRNRRMQSRG